jgi:MSHA biogenesis protein MshG
MPSYLYKGTNKSGKTIVGIIEASSPISVAKHLSRIEITPVSINKSIAHHDFSQLMAYKFGIGRPSLETLIIFSRQMQSMLKAKIDIIRALQLIIASSKNAILRNALTNIILNLEAGFGLALSFQKQGKIFLPIVVGMIAVGENSNALVESFTQITRYLETELTTKKRIGAALRYPIIVLVAIFAAVVIVNFMVVPVFEDFFATISTPLPLITRGLIGSSNLFLNYWWLMLISLLLTSAGFIGWVRTNFGRYQWDRIKLRIPLIGSLLHRSLMARFCRTLSMSQHSGMPLLPALKLVAETTHNRYLSQRIMGMLSGLKNGESLVQTAIKTEIFSPIVIQMLNAAQESGDLNSMLLEVAHYYEMDVDYDLKRVGDLLEPILIAIVAVLVLILALGVFLPMWDLSDIAMQKMKQA